MTESYVESFFADIPYSEEAFAAKAAIKRALKASAEARSGSFEKIVKAYPDLGSLARLAGFAQEDVRSWRSVSGLISDGAALSLFRKRRLYSYLLSFFAVSAASYAVNSVFYLQPFFLILIAAMLGLCWLTCIKLPRAGSPSLSLEAYHKVLELNDKYLKKLYNKLFFGFALFALLFYSAFMLDSNSSKFQELFEFFVMNLLIIEAVLWFTLKNLLIVKWCGKMLGDRPKRRLGRICLWAIAALSAIYWAVILVMFRMFNTTNILSALIALLLYALAALSFNLTLRKKLTYKNLRVSKARITLGAVAVLLAGGYLLIQRDVWLTQPYINITPNVYERSADISYEENKDGTGVYTLSNRNPDGQFRILQLTDIHLGGSLSTYPNDLKALKACRELIEYAKPDLVVVTGDLCYPVGISSFSLNNTAPVMQFASFMRNLGVPWAFTYGNHDTESIAASGKEALSELYTSLGYKTSKNLLYPYSQPTGEDGQITGRNNQYIQLKNADGSLAGVLFLIDSNAYVGKGYSRYDCIRDDQVAWYERSVKALEAREGKPVSSYAFFHIPLTQYRDAYQAYLAGENSVRYFFGQNEEGGKEIAEICCPDDSSSFFETAVRLGSTKGMFCGHDHYNNMSLEYQGIRLTYGMSIDYLVMPGIVHQTKQRGATLLVLDQNGEMTLEQIPYESIQGQLDK